MGPAWGLHGACMRPAWGLHGACMGPAWGLNVSEWGLNGVKPALRVWTRSGQTSAGPSSSRRAGDATTASGSVQSQVPPWAMTFFSGGAGATVSSYVGLSLAKATCPQYPEPLGMVASSHVTESWHSLTVWL